MLVTWWRFSVLTCVVAAAAGATALMGSRPVAVEPLVCSVAEPAATLDEALDEPTNLECVEKPLADVLDELERRHGVQIRLDERALLDNPCLGPMRVTCTLHKVKLRSALNRVLDPLGLAFATHDEILLITTQSEVENLLSTRVYPIADLAGWDDRSMVMIAPSHGQLITVITESIEPTTWEDVGGPGTIKFHRKSGALVVSQTDGVHYQIAALLDSLRRVGFRQTVCRASHREQPEPDADGLRLVVYRLSPQWAQSCTPMLFGPVPGIVLYTGSDPAAAAAPAGTTQAPAPQAPSRLLCLTALQALGEAIPYLIEPKSWEVSGGRGTIRAVNVYLMVRQTEAVHEQIRKLLENLDTT